MRNLDLATGAGELPPTECWPELWIADDDRLADAQAILRKALAPIEAVRKPWRCGNCSEEIEGQFSACWSCGEDRDLRIAALNPAGTDLNFGRSH